MDTVHVKNCRFVFLSVAGVLLLSSSTGAQTTSSLTTTTLPPPVAVLHEEQTRLVAEIPFTAAPECAAGAAQCMMGVIQTAERAVTETDLWEQKLALLDLADQCGCVRTDGCFAPGTKLLLSDQSTREIERIAVGDSLWNPITKQAVTVKQVIEGAEEAPLIEISSKSRSVTVSSAHPMFTQAGVKKASAISKEDRLLGADGTYEAIERIVTLPVRPKQRVLNVVLSMEGENGISAVVANGFVTGDLTVQQSIAH